MTKNEFTTTYYWELNDVCSQLNIPIDWLACVIQHESGFDPHIKNSLGYVGLIQIGKLAAIDLGLTRDQIQRMDTPEQLQKAVLPFYKNVMRQRSVTHFSEPADLYLATFYPAYIGKSDATKFPDNVVANNPSFFKEGSTLGDFRQWVRNYCIQEETYSYSNSPPLVQEYTSTSISSNALNAVNLSPNTAILLLFLLLILTAGTVLVTEGKVKIA